MENEINIPSNPALNRPQLIGRLDRLLAGLGIVIGLGSVVGFVWIKLYQPIGLAVVLVFTSAIYLAESRVRIAERAKQPAALMTLSPVWVHVSLPLVTGISLWCVFASINATERPILVFILLSLIPGWIVTQSLLVPETAVIRQSLLIQLGILAVTMVITAVTVFPFNGGDTWAHLANAQQVIERGTVVALADAYRDYPLYPGFLASFSILTGFTPETIARSLNVFVSISVLLLVYATAQEQKNAFYRTIILLLLLLGSKWFIYWSVLVVAMTVGILFFTLLVVLLIGRAEKQFGLAEILLIALLAAFAPFFHPVISMGIILLLVGGWVIDFIFRGSFASKRSLLGIGLFVVTMTLAQWIYFGEFIFSRTVVSLASAIFRDGETALRLAESARSPLFYTLDQVSFYFLLCCAGIEILRQVYINDKPANLFAGVLGMLFLLFGYGTQIVNLQAVLPHRWLLFGTILLVFPASYTFVNWFNRKHPIRMLGAVTIISLYFLFGLINTEANRDHPFYGAVVTQQIEMTASEASSLEFIERYILVQDETVRVDFRYWDYLKLTAVRDQVGYWDQIDLTEFTGAFIVRDAYYERMFFSPGFSEELKRNQGGLSEFYDSGDVKIVRYQSDMWDVEVR